MRIRATDNTRLDIPDDNIEALIQNGSTWFEDENGIVEVSEYREWKNSQWVTTAYQWQHETTGETHLIPLTAYKGFQLA